MGPARLFVSIMQSLREKVQILQTRFRGPDYKLCSFRTVTQEYKRHQAVFTCSFRRFFTLFSYRSSLPSDFAQNRVQKGLAWNFCCMIAISAFASRSDVLSLSRSSSGSSSSCRFAQKKIAWRGAFAGYSDQSGLTLLVFTSQLRNSFEDSCHCLDLTLCSFA